MNGNNVKIGVYICHCGTNISHTVNIDELVKYVADLGGVAVCKDYKYMCSEPGQEMIKKDIKELGLTRVVVSSCSPLLHENTFRKACADGGLNPYLFQMANIREQCSWVTKDTRLATEKAKKIVSAAVRRVVRHEEMEVKKVPINSNVLVLGGGIAGIEAALRLANSGRKVFLVEKEASIGGRMAGLDKTFPTLDCAACILTPKMSQVAQNKNITIISYSEVADVSGYVGNFKVKIRKKPRYVDIEKCTGCGICWSHCPTSITPSQRIIRKEELIISQPKNEER